MFVLIDFDKFLFFLEIDFKISSLSEKGFFFYIPDNFHDLCQQLLKYRQNLSYL